MHFKLCKTNEIIKSKCYLHVDQIVIKKTTTTTIMEIVFVHYDESWKLFKVIKA